MNAEQRVAKMLDTIKAGACLMVCTHGRAWEIDQAVVDKFNRAGKPVLFARGGSVFMQIGKRADCIDYCRIEAIY